MHPVSVISIATARKVKSCKKLKASQIYQSVDECAGKDKKSGVGKKRLKEARVRTGEVGLSEGKGTRYEPSVEAKAKTKV